LEKKGRARASSLKEVLETKHDSKDPSSNMLQRRTERDTQKKKFNKKGKKRRRGGSPQKLQITQIETWSLTGSPGGADQALRRTEGVRWEKRIYTGGEELGEKRKKARIKVLYLWKGAAVGKRKSNLRGARRSGGHRKTSVMPNQIGGRRKCWRYGGGKKRKKTQ